MNEKNRSGTEEAPQQGDLFPPADLDAPPRSHAIPAWLRVLELLLFVILRVYIGALVILLPWSTLWRNNAFLNHWPSLAAFLSLGAVRGIVSGLGVLNIWIAVAEILRRRLHS